MDGGVAIVDQSICSHARYFLGSYESTFTFRIQEEREVLGFSTKKTFDMFCADGKFDCERGSIWKIEYPKKDRDKDELWNFWHLFYSFVFDSSFVWLSYALMCRET